MDNVQLAPNTQNTASGKQFAPCGREVQNNRETVYEFSIGLRFTHWLRAACIVFLVVSGFYLSYVFIAPRPSDEPVNFLNAFWRSSHQIAGFVLIGCMIFKTYLFLFDKQSKLERQSVKDSVKLKVWLAQLKYYLNLGEHPHLSGNYNPLQFVAYFFFYVVLFGISLTGLILYANVYHEGLGGFIAPLMKWCEASIFNGLGNVRVVHHICMWAIILFVVGHVYMVIYNAIKGKDGAVDAVVSGYKYIKDGVRT